MKRPKGKGPAPRKPASKPASKPPRKPASKPAGRAAQLTKPDWIRKFRVLQQQVDVGGLHDLQAHHEELRTQNEQLIVAQQLLEESVERYVALYDFAPVGYTTLSSVGTIEEANLTLARLLGIERRLLVGRSLRTFVDDADRGAFLDHLAAFGRGESMQGVELRLIANGGVSVPVRLTTRGTASRSLLSIVTDLTEQARLEAERQVVALREAAARAASDAKDRFLAILSHELRTPLTPILAAVSSFPGIAETPPALLGLVEIVRRNVVLEARLIDDLLDVTRIEHGKLWLDVAAVDLHEIAREAAGERHDPAPGPAHEIVLDLRAAAHHVAADRMRLRQVLWNLLGNARRYSPDGGAITLRTRDDAPGWIRFTIEDRGIGIVPGLLAEIFTPFVQAERRAPGARGLGLGLAICKGIVAAHGGEIAVASPGLGRGTTVTLRWKTAAAPVAAVPARAPVVLAARSLRILLVEDDPDSATALAMLLRLGRHEVTVATTCKQARASLEPRPDLLISDLDLPDGNGFELVAELRRGRPFPALALSGFGSAEDVRRSREAGFEEHLVKPIERATLSAAIARVMALADRAGLAAAERPN